METQSSYPYDLEEEPRGCIGCAYIIVVFFIFIVAVAIHHSLSKESYKPDEPITNTK